MTCISKAAYVCMHVLERVFQSIYAWVFYKQANRRRVRLRRAVHICADLQISCRVRYLCALRQFGLVAVIDNLSASQETPVSLEALKDSLPF